MREGITAAGLGGVADGMAEIQQGAAAAVEFVGGDVVVLDGHTAGDHIFQSLPGGNGIESGKQPFFQDGVFDHFGKATGQFPVGESTEGIGIAQDQKRLMEGAGQILAALKVNGRLPPYGGINGGQQRGRQLYEIDSTLVRGGCEAAHVAGDTAAQGYDHVGTGQLRGAHGLQDASPGLQILALFAVPEDIVIHKETGALQTFHHGPAVGNEHVLVGDDERGGGFRHGADGSATVPQQPLPDPHVICARRVYVNCFHDRPPQIGK